MKTLFNEKEQIKIGMLTPSSNTTLEPICSSMVHGLEDKVTMHYGRFKVTEISLNKNALEQFNLKPMLEAAELLADADVDVIAWNGTSGGWLGFEADYKLCETIKKTTGIPATTSMLAQIDSFKAQGAKKIHLITPYIKEINKLIREQYEKFGFEVINDRCLEQTVNRSFSLVTESQILNMCDEVCSQKADALSIVCTNLPAMWYVPKIEEKYNITVHDTINSVVWKSMKMVGIDPSLINGWGKIFKL